jgi:uncharacterized protein YecT (DUF1311 family)
MATKFGILAAASTGVLLSLPGAAAAASFDCSGKLTAGEQLVCNNVVLSDLDSRLEELYSASIASLSPEGADLLRASERSWIKHIDTICPNMTPRPMRADTPTSCMVNRYRERLGQLQKAAFRSGPYLIERVDMFAAEPAPKDGFGHHSGFYVQHVAFPRIDSPKTNETLAWNKRSARSLSLGDDCGQGDEDTDYELGYASQSVISIRWTDSLYCHGTPHGMYGTRSDNVLVSAGWRTLRTDDVICSQPQCSGQLHKIFRGVLEAEGWSPPQNQPSIWANIERDMASPNYWLLTPEGVAIAFPEAEGGCYACNPPNITIPWTVLKPVLVPNAPVP